jgi:pyruvate formate lyase activating enzyme
MASGEAMTSVQERLDALTGSAAADLVERLPDGALRCFACGHRCLIREGRRGICRVRSNQGGVLRVPRGYVGALQVDPVEKKPFFHCLPGSTALSFGMLGCDLHCGYCQNWVTSQALRDPASTTDLREMEGADLVALARKSGSPILVSTYNEPLITAEWAVEVFREARAAGMLTGFVSNGNGTPEVLRFLRPWVDLYKVDLKAFREPAYRTLGGELKNVTATIERLHEMGFWLEIVTLLVPGLNDSEEEIRDLVRFVAGVSPDIPWHCTAFHPDYKMSDRDFTSADLLLRAAALGREAGLRYVYPGNLPGRVGDNEDTRCPSCRRTLIRRVGFRVLEDLLTPTGGKCPGCGTGIPGVWTRPARTTGSGAA